ncbi:hypothetical protein [Acinetobacter pragensis]|uniref:hypothetical protein n=1 Tax=Acinetobacter pragensis TaxID=1806892 RepID=UPI003340304B
MMPPVCYLRLKTEADCSAVSSGISAIVQFYTVLVIFSYIMILKIYDPFYEASMNSEERSELFIQQIQNVLLHDWDPLNIRKNSSMQDEYDAYIVDVLDILEDEKATAAEIAHCLQEIEHEFLGLKKPTDRAEKAAAKIWQHFENFIA